MRLFVGLPVPPEIAQSLIRLAQRIQVPGGRWTRPENIHLTLFFLGEAGESAVEAIKNELCELDFAPFQLKLTGLNTFARAGVLFAEVEASQPLLRLQEKVATHMARCGFAQEVRPYRPHLTLARFRGRLRLGKGQLALPASLQYGFRADTIILYRSNLTSRGPHYEVLIRKGQ